MRVQDVLFVPGLNGFFYDDQEAIRRGARQGHFVYQGEPVTRGYSAVRIAGEALSVVLVLGDGQVAVGDCTSVQYSGVGGREGLFRASGSRNLLEEVVRPFLESCDLFHFRPLAEAFEALLPEGQPLPLALRYGVTQALLDAVAKARGLTMAEVLCEEYGTEPALSPLPLYAQSGEARYANAEKMILKGVDVLPHGLFNSVEPVGQKGERLRDYLVWLKGRIQSLGPPGYRPTVHVDVYGTLGIAFERRTDRLLDYLLGLEEALSPLPLNVESPVDAGGREAQIEALAEITEGLRARDSRVRVVADEWCNTGEDIRAFAKAKACHMVQVKTPDLGGIQNSAEALLLCRELGVAPYLGGSCTDTDHSARIAVHIALATRPEQVLAKPGMGVDEGLMIVKNEMARTQALLRRSRPSPVGPEPARGRTRA